MERTIAVEALFKRKAGASDVWDVVTVNGERLQVWNETLAGDIGKHAGKGTVTVEVTEKQGKQKDDGTYWINKSITEILGSDAYDGQQPEEASAPSTNGAQLVAGKDERQESIEFQTFVNAAYGFGGSTGLNHLECLGIVMDLVAARKLGFTKKEVEQT